MQIALCVLLSVIIMSLTSCSEDPMVNFPLPPHAEISSSCIELRYEKGQCYTVDMSHEETVNWFISTGENDGRKIHWFGGIEPLGFAIGNREHTWRVTLNRQTNNTETEMYVFYY